MEIELTIIRIKGKEIIMSFNILLLGNNKAVLVSQTLVAYITGCID